MYALNKVAKAWSVDHCRRAQHNDNDHHDHRNDILVHYICLLKLVTPTYMYASAWRTVSREAWVPKPASRLWLLPSVFDGQCVDRLCEDMALVRFDFYKP